MGKFHLNNVKIYQSGKFMQFQYIDNSYLQSMFSFLAILITTLTDFPPNMLSPFYAFRPKGFRRQVIDPYLFHDPSVQTVGPSVSFTIETIRPSSTEWTILVSWTTQITSNKYDSRLVHFQW